MTIFVQEHTKNENLGANSNDEDFLSYWKVKDNARLYLPTVFALNKGDKQHPLPLRQLFEVQHLDPKYWLIMMIVDKPEGNFTMDTSAFLLRVKLPDGLVQTYMPAV